jgi:WD40 repeat protein
MDQTVNTAKEQASQAQKTIRSLAFSTDGAQLATGGDDGLIHLWNASTGKYLETLHGHAGAVADLAFLEGDSLLSTSADQSAVLWETRPNWKLVARLGASAENPLDVSQSPFIDRVLCLDFSPDGTKLATGGGDPSRSGQLHLWDVASRSIIREFSDAHSDTVFDVEFSWDGKKLVSGAADKFIKAFDVESGAFIRAYEGHTSHVLGVAWKADDSAIASAGADNAIKLWNTTTGEQLRTITGYNKQVTDIDFVGVQDIIVTCGGDSQVRTYNANNGSPRRQFGGSVDFVYAVTATRDEALIISAGEDGVIRLWNGTNGQAITSFEPPISATETASTN